VRREGDRESVIVPKVHDERLHCSEAERIARARPNAKSTVALEYVSSCSTGIR
jgi:hypothetical protein